MRHALLSPSSSGIWLKCPANPKYSQKGEYKVGIPAATGTLIHQMAEMKQKGNLENTTLEGYWLGKVEKVEDFEITVDRDMIKCAEVYVDYVAERVKDLDGKLLVEEQVSLEEISSSCWGTADALILSKQRIAVIDLKSGKWPVDVKNNTQLMIYALGALSRYGNEDTTMEITIVQPRAWHRDGPIRTWDISAVDLVDWAYQTLQPACELAEEETPQEILGDHCRFCNGKSMCVAYNEKGEEDVSNK